MCVRLDGVESRHVHLQQPVFPVGPGDPAVVNTAGDVAEIFSILQEAVVFIIYCKTRSSYRELTDKKKQKLYLNSA